MRASKMAVGVLLCAMSGGCVGSLEDAAAGPSGAGPRAPGTPSVLASPELRLLTEREYVHDVEALLGVDVSGEAQPRRQVTRGHGGIAAVQQVGYDSVERFYSIGERAAAAAMARDASGCAGEEACLRAWGAGLIDRAFRDDVTDEQRTSYLEILERDEAGATLGARVESMVIALLSSPSFLYRFERGGEPVPERVGARWLDDVAIASRLSHLVWESAPDDALREAALEGRLQDPAERLAQLDRMLADPRAQRGMRGFVLDWMGVFHEPVAGKDAAVLQGTSTTLPASVRASFERTVDAVLFPTTGTPPSFGALLDTDRFWVDAEVAPLLGVPAPAAGALEERTLDPAQRLGLLTHPLVVAAHSKESGASPFPIGKFVFENILCDVIPPPPPGIPAIDDSGGGAMTLRDQLESVTSAPGCADCHRRIGPPGFAFLPFDPIARHRATDGAGRAWQTAGSVEIGGRPIAFENVSELASELASAPETQRCVATRMFRWTFGRFEGEGDAALLARVRDAAERDGASPRVLLETLVASDEFAQTTVSGGATR